MTYLRLWDYQPKDEDKLYYIIPWYPAEAQGELWKTVIDFHR